MYRKVSEKNERVTLKMGEGWFAGCDLGLWVSGTACTTPYFLGEQQI